MAEDIKTTGIDQKKLRPLIEKVREKIKKHDVVKDMFLDYDIDLSEIDLIPMCFADIDVSARTDHGVIYFNTDLLEGKEMFNDDDHYMTHEVVHFLQQTTGDSPTKGSSDGNYLDNKYEIEGFQNQLEYIADTEGKSEANKYVDQVLDHHDVQEGRDKKKEELMDAVAFRNNVFLKLLGA